MRKRKKLEVSTFPFLAVLLCTMGSLILLLLVIDKKAKKAALEKLFLARKQSVDSTSDIVGNEKILLENQAKLMSQITAMKEKIREFDSTSPPPNTRERQAFEKTRKDIDSLKEKVLKSNTALETAKKKEQSLASETRTISSNLLKLEATLEQLKASKNKEKATYSIIPYSGKKGLNRRPLYLECAANGIIFHPDGKSISPETDPTLLLMEIESRCDQLRVFLADQLGAKDAVPYLMILVRPEGIAHYWGLQNIIKKMDLDFGYELIDQGWNLEIPNQDIPIQPKLVANGSNTPVKPLPKPLPHTGSSGFPTSSQPLKPLTGLPPAPNENKSGSNNPDASGNYSTGNDTSLPGIRNPLQNQDSHVAGNNLNPGTNQQGMKGVGNSFKPRPGGYSAGTIQSFPKTGPDGIPLGTGKGDEIRGLDPYASSNKKDPHGQFKDPKNPKYNPNPNLIDKSPLAGLPGFPNAEKKSILPDNAKGNSENSGNDSGGIGQSGNNSSIGKKMPGQDSQGPGKSNDSNIATNKLGTPNPVNGSSTGQPGTPTETNKVNSQLTTPPANTPGNPQTQGTPTIEVNLTNKQPGAENPPSQTSPRTTYSANEDGPPADTPEALSRVATPLPELGPRKSKTPPPLRAARLFAERDWILHVECRFEGVILHASKKFYSAEALATETGSRSFLGEIQALIDKKQASVRAGDPPYRPQVRFLIWADGPRSYHLAYPLLHKAGIWQTAQQLEPEDNIKDILQGRGK